MWANFYPRPPRGGRPIGLGVTGHFIGFLSTPSARRATQGWCDHRQPKTISIHALREEGDAFLHCLINANTRFLSTPSARRATTTGKRIINIFKDFYPRPPRGGRPDVEAEMARLQKISIHALREEGDDQAVDTLHSVIQFLSTPSARRATGVVIKCFSFFRFLSTPSARRATGISSVCSPRITISIHALREEGDPIHSGAVTGKDHFYPRPPRGGRRICYARTNRNW